MAPAKWGCLWFEKLQHVTAQLHTGTTAQQPNRPHVNCKEEGNETNGHVPSPPGASVADDFILRIEPIPMWRLAIIFACIGMGLLLSVMDTTIVATMLYDFGRGIRAQNDQSSRNISQLIGFRALQGGGGAGL
ncbi:uncharacterized protein THITE_2092129 [Thermothielavioides terrestris NRRL 8126]|uniref:Uncharacterized protein n=1 Tax=Thermothielavioides terrestris (strain ATCC 38088 / NRRL 8126) TaxID=578455 RepID=G2RCN2_THETT|nr:uncharacterized protein THITE_2092129 [Thermothielavioides terrestris NRRL 8126]AEO70628.1 hypothetical protein THITE_2092129 [Thermothielavioides terrestris NRRL 8126]